jgi:translation initiation factor IF-3/ribosomal protein L35
VRLVGPNGEQVGIVAIGEAIKLAQDSDLDLVEVAPMARPPVCKLMDYGKFKYETAQKARESRKNQVLTVIKEMKLRPKIDPHDYATKKGHVVRFLKAGDKVKITIMFRGREQSRPELGLPAAAAPRRGRPGARLRGVGAEAGRPQHDHGAGPAQERRRPQEGRQGRARRRRQRGHRRSGGRAGQHELVRPQHRPTRRTRGPVHPSRRTTAAMPKQKTHSGAKKRFKVTGSGKIMREQAGKRHLLEKKPSTLTRRLTGEVEVAPADRSKIKKLLGI